MNHFYYLTNLVIFSYYSRLSKLRHVSKHSSSSLFNSNHKHLNNNLSLSSLKLLNLFQQKSSNNYLLNGEILDYHDYLSFGKQFGILEPGMLSRLNFGYIYLYSVETLILKSKENINNISYTSELSSDTKKQSTSKLHRGLTFNGFIKVLIQTAMLLFPLPDEKLLFNPNYQSSSLSNPPPPPQKTESFSSLSSSISELNAIGIIDQLKALFLIMIRSIELKLSNTINYPLSKCTNYQIKIKHGKYNTSICGSD